MRKPRLAGDPECGYCKIVHLVLPLLLLVPTPLALGQIEPSPGEPIISVDVGLVLLQVTVRDKKGEFVSGLGKDNFQVFEDRHPQAIRFFQHEDVPVAVGLIVDNSGSMGRKKKEVTAAALTFVHSSNPSDEMFVVNFNEHVFFGLPGTRLFSAGMAELERALNGVPASGRTALYDAVETGLNYLSRATLDRKALIVISDGGDNASHVRLDQVLNGIGRSDVMIYTVGLFDEDDHDRNPQILKKIAHRTGGEAFLPNETSDVVPICRRIAQDIRSQYTIGYAPTNPNLDNTYRTIRVTAVGPHHGKYVVRTRAGYIASSNRKPAPEHEEQRVK